MDQQAKQLYRSLVTELIQFKTISTGDYQDEIERAVAWLERKFADNGFEVDVIRGYDNPIILAEKHLADDSPTVLVYGHYDVQPASIEEWGSDPFEVREANGRLYARGIVDNKGQFLVHAATVFALLQADSLKYNVKFLIEGNEETGSPHIAEFLRQYQKQLAADLILLSDGDIAPNGPVIEVSMRGVLNTTILLKTSDHELHSGIYGGAVPNAAYEAANLMAKIYHNDRRITLPGFYDSVVDTTTTKELLEIGEPDFLKVTGVKQTLLEAGQTISSQIGTRPTLEITGFSSGYTGVGYRNSVPASAEIKLNFRLAHGQDPKQVLEQLEQFLKTELPDYVDYEIKKPESHEGVLPATKIDYDNKFFNLVKTLLEESYQAKVKLKYEGAVVPIARHFQEILQTNLLLVPLVNHDSNMHAVDENLNLQILEKALTFSNNFFSALE